MLEFENFENYRKTGPDKSEYSSDKLLKILSMISISIQKHELDILEILNMRSISIKKHEMEIW